jgi:hypothetical protein
MSFDLENNLQRTSEESPERIIDQWRLGERIGRGTFGKVYLARDTTTGERVALKIFDQSLETSGYLRELGLMFDEQHPNIVETLSFGYTEGQKYIVYEYVGGGNLRDLLVSENRVSPLMALRILAGAARGLAYAHEVDVVHRDMKPENLLLTNPSWPFTVKICDFGLSARATTDQQLDESYGSPAYMAPEQFEGQYDHRVDFYSVGVILYEMLFGRRPLSGDASAISHAHEHVGIQLPNKGSPGIRRILNHTLTEDPAARYERVEALLEDLERVTERLECGEESTHIPEPETKQLTFSKDWAARLSGLPDCWEATRDGIFKMAIHGRIAALTPAGQLFELAQSNRPVDGLLAGGTASETIGWRTESTIHIVHRGNHRTWDLASEIAEGPFRIVLDPSGEYVAVVTDEFLQLHERNGETAWRATIDTYGTLPAFCFVGDGERMWLSTEEPRTQLYCLTRDGEPLVRTAAPASDFSLCASDARESVVLACHGTPRAFRVGDDGFIEREAELFEPAVDVHHLSDNRIGISSAGHIEVLDGETLESRSLVKLPTPEKSAVVSTSGVFQMSRESDETFVEYWALGEHGELPQ